MTTSSTAKCSAVRVLSRISKRLQALSDATNKKSPTASKKKPSSASKRNQKGGGGPNPMLVSFYQLLLLHTHTHTHAHFTGIKYGCLAIRFRLLRSRSCCNNRHSQNQSSSLSSLLLQRQCQPVWIPKCRNIPRSGSARCGLTEHLEVIPGFLFLLGSNV